MITIVFFTTLRLELKRSEVKLIVQEASVLDILIMCESEIGKKFVYKLVGEDSRIIPGTIILLNGKNILHLMGMQTPVKDNDLVSVFPPGGGG